ncbi:MAG: hypothetical protein ACOVNL_09805 [Prochlorococcaceae cyanobacterium]|jgi:hypothetical protein
MAQPIGRPEGETPSPRTPRQDKKKGCRKKKCSHWKGGSCRCGRD